MHLSAIRSRLLQFALLLAALGQFAVPRSLAPADATPNALGWTPRGAFADREFTSIVSPPGYPCVVAFTALQNGGLGLSTDCGVQFASLIPTNAYSVTAKDTNVGYLAAGGAGVLKTVDGGANWFAVNDGLPLSRDARAILIHLTNPDTVYCGFYGSGVFFGTPSVGDLVGWQAMNEGLSDLSVRHLVRVRGGTFYLAATESGIWRRAGGVWTRTEPGLVANRLLIDVADSSRVYAVGPTGVHRSFDEGRSFAPASTGLPAGVVVNDIARRTDVANVLYVGTRGAGVYESLDYGDSWHPFGPPVSLENDVRAVLCTVETAEGLARLFAGTRKDGLFEADYSTPATPTTWGRLKASYR